MEQVIKIENLVQSYEDNKQILKGINLNIFPGQIIGYIGPNGAGKTTTVKILTGMLSEFEGKVDVLGKDIRSNSLEIKQKVGYIPENAALYNTLTPVEYLNFVGGFYDIKPHILKDKISELLGLLGLIESMELRMSSFSKGMRQKVLIIGGILHNPEILFMDEPLSGLDANSTILVKEILEQFANNGKTIFYCSHIMDVVERISDRIIIINNGKIIADAPFEELQKLNINGHSENESLENIFTDLTGNGNQTDTATKFVNIVNG